MQATTKVTKQATKATTKATATNVQANVQAATTPVNGLAALVAQAVSNVTATAPTKRPPVTLTNGVNPLAPTNAPVVTLGGVPYSGNLPPTNPALRGVVGTPSAKLGNMLVLGNGKGPVCGHNVIMWQAVVAAIAAGATTPAQLAQAAGSGGAAFIRYATKNGWLAKA